MASVWVTRRVQSIPRTRASIKVPEGSGGLRSVSKGARFPSSTLSPFFLFGDPLSEPSSRKKGTLIIKGLLGNQRGLKGHKKKVLGFSIVDMWICGRIHVGGYMIVRLLVTNPQAYKWYHPFSAYSFAGLCKIG